MSDLKTKVYKGFFPCPYCHGRAVYGSHDQGMMGGDIPEDCGACDGTGAGRKYMEKKNAQKA